MECIRQQHERVPERSGQERIHAADLRSTGCIMRRVIGMRLARTFAHRRCDPVALRVVTGAGEGAGSLLRRDLSAGLVSVESDWRVGPVCALCRERHRPPELAGDG